MYKARKANKQKILYQSNKRIFTSFDLALLWDIKNRNTLLKTIQRYIEREILYRIYKGLYSTIPLKDLDKYEVACAIGGPFSYISAESVLAKEGIIFQELKKVTLFGKKQKEITIGGTTYLCRYLNEKYLLNRTGIEDTPGYSVATVERALADIRHINPKYYIDNTLSIDNKKLNYLIEEVGYYVRSK